MNDPADFRFQIDPDGGFRKIDERLDLRKALSDPNLWTPREQFVMGCLYFKDVSTETIASIYGVEQGTVREWEQSALEKLHERLS